MLFIVNPHSSRGRTAAAWRSIRPEILSSCPGLAEHYTTEPGEAVEVVRRALTAGEDRIVAVGGDGTLNEVVNGYFGGDFAPINPRAAVGLIPIGTGSDFRRTLGLAGLRDAARIALGGASTQLDVLRVESGGQARLALNIVSFGLGGEVVRLVNSWRDRLPRAIGGFPRFVAAALIALGDYRNMRVELLLDDEELLAIESGFFLAANGRYAGGGMKFAPHALPDDGWIELIAIDGLDRLGILLELPGIRMGRHLRNPRVIERRVREITVTSRESLAIDIDGETAGWTPARITVMPRALRFLAGPSLISRNGS